MKMINFIQMNDWKITNFLKVIFSIQIAVLGIIGLEQLGLKIPFLTETIGFFYLTYIPGIIILRCLKIHRLGNTKTIVYSVSLSLALLMFTGLFMNSVYPLFGVNRPLSTIPLVLTLTLLIGILSILSFMNDKNQHYISYIDYGYILKYPQLFLVIIPFLSVIGTYLINFYDNNILLLVMIILITIIFILTSFNKVYGKRVYPLIIFIFSITLLYHRSLISTSLVGFDIQTEYHLSKLVLANGFWNWNLSNAYNGVISTNILAPFYSIYTGLNLIWVFKIIYPLLFSIVPLGLYILFKSQTNAKIAFISCFLFMSLFMFYNEMLQLARQQIAEIFLVMIVLILLEVKIDKLRKSLLLVIYAFSISVSHYGISYIYMFIFTISWIIIMLIKIPPIQELKNYIKSEFLSYNKTYQDNLTNENKIKLNFLVLFVVFTLAWYIYVSSAFSFLELVKIGNHILSSVSSEFLNPEYTEGLNYIFMDKLSISRQLAKYIHLSIQLMIGLGFILVLLKPKIAKFNKEYIILSFVNLLMLMSAIFIPFFARSLNTTRFYHIALIFLSPFCVIGIFAIYKLFLKVIKKPNHNYVEKSLKILSLFLAISFLFNSGIIYEVLNDNPTSIMLNNEIDYPRFNNAEYSSARWIHEKKENNSIYSDRYRSILLLNFDLEKAKDVSKVESIKPNSYLFFGTYNLRNNVVLYWKPGISADLKKEYVSMKNIIINKDLIYNNGYSKTFFYRDKY